MFAKMDSPPSPCDILILTGSIGAGHCSAAHAIERALARIHHGTIRTETIDFMTSLESFAVNATKKVYLNSLKISPKIWEVVFAGSTKWEWPVKFLNMMTAPFMINRLRELIVSRSPKAIVSTFPLWDIALKKIWDEYAANELLRTSGEAHPTKRATKNSLRRPFISVITDSISVHAAWTMGHPDYFIVPNDDTRIALQNYNIPRKHIKVFGYPVGEHFYAEQASAERAAFLERQELDPKKLTLLLILPVGLRVAKVRAMARALARVHRQNIQLLIIAYGSPEWCTYLSNSTWPFPTVVTGWTNEMHNYIHAADIVLTKAGGATVMECIAAGKPMIIIDALPGQEMGNATLVQKYNIGHVLDKNCRGLEGAIEYIEDNRALMERNLRRLQRPQATEKIAEFLAGFVT